MYLDDRKKQILRAIVEGYIQNAEPVGSRSIAKNTDLHLSAATIRNEMGDLEDMGFLLQPHTSAGRIPSGMGFRFYVDSIMERYRMTASEIHQMENAMLLKLRELDKIVKDVSAAFSNIIGLPVFGMVPAMNSGIVKGIKLVSVDDSTLMIIVSDQSGFIKNKLLRLKTPVSEDEATEITRVLNQNLVGFTRSEINLEQILEIANAVGGDHALFTSILEVVNEAISEIDERDIYTEGTTNILRFPEYNDITKIKDILEFFDDKQRLEVLIRQFSQNKNSNVQVLIGDENQEPVLKHNAVVLSTYHVGSDLTGAIGIVGPMRMDYAKVVTAVEFFAKQLGKMLSEHIESTPTLPRQLTSGSSKGDDTNE